MATEVKIPQISEDVESADVTEVLVKEGDKIEKDQSLIVVESDKASVEVPSSHAGTVKEIKVSEGDTVNVGDVILIVDEEGGEEDEGKEEGKEEKKEKKSEEEEERDESEEQEEKAEKEKEEDRDLEEKEEGKEEGKEEEKEKKEKKPEEKKEKLKEEGKTDEEIPASPAVRRLAREKGVDLSSVEGSGPGGRITEEDIKSHTTKKDKGKAAKAKLSLPDFSKWGATEKKSLSGIRVATGKSTTSSWQSIPHVFQFDEADISGIEEYMEKNQEKAKEAGGKLTITAILVKIAANALQQFPKFNASIDPENEEMILKKYFNISIAVDTENGLLMPVITDVERKSIIELAVEISEIAEKARSGKLSPEEMKGGNFSISNLGGIGGTNFTPIIYHPQVAILGVSKAKKQPVFIQGKFEPRNILPLSLSYDHRLIDGAEGAKFLNWIAQALEDPYKALLGV